MNPISITDTKLFNIKTRFSQCNLKCGTTAEAKAFITACESYGTYTAKIVKMVQLTTEDFDTFSRNLMADHEWLAGEGGADTDLEGFDTPFWEWTDERLDLFRENSYTLVVAVAAEGRETIYVNPEGYSYARYVGFPLS